MLKDKLRGFIEMKCEGYKSNRDHIYMGFQREPPLNFNLTSMVKLEQISGQLDLLMELKNLVGDDCYGSDE